MTIRLLLADDQKIIRDWVRSLLRGDAELEIVAEAEDGNSALELVRQHTPDLVLMDIAMPGMNGVEATRQILAEKPETKVIALSAHEERRYVTGLLLAGASGYLLKERAAEELVAAIHKVHSNQIYLSPRIVGVILGELVRMNGLLSREAAGRQLAEPDPAMLLPPDLHAEDGDLVVVGRIAHDLNNVLTTILGYVQLVLMTTEEQHPSHADLLAIDRAAQKGSGLTHQLLEIGRRARSGAAPQPCAPAMLPSVARAEQVG